MYEATSINTDIIRESIESTIVVLVGHVQNPNPPRLEILEICLIT